MTTVANIGIPLWEVSVEFYLRVHRLLGACSYTVFSLPEETDLLTPLQHYWGYSSFVRCGARGAESAGGERHLCRHAHGRRQSCATVAAVSEDGRGGDFSADCADAGPGGATGADGNPGRGAHSSLSDDQQSQTMRKAARGAYRLLLCLSGTRGRKGTLEWLQHVPIGFFAIDEAHCISNGARICPEYRQLNCLRTKFPDRPIAAFTASATRHVRHDILAQLQLAPTPQIHRQLFTAESRICDPPMR